MTNGENVSPSSDDASRLRNGASPRKNGAWLACDESFSDENNAFPTGDDRLFGEEDFSNGEEASSPAKDKPCMKDCVSKVVSEIRSLRSADFQESLLEALLLVEKFASTGAWHGISDNVEDAEVSPENMADLRHALTDFAQEQREHPDVGTALWALCKFHDVTLRGFFLSEMRHHCWARRYHPVWQADCALEILTGEGAGYEYAPGELKLDAYFAAVRGFLLKQDEFRPAAD